MIENVKMILADIDGTLVSKGEKMLPITRDALVTMHNHGVLFGIATGRAVDSAMFKKGENWELPFEIDAYIGMNGGQIWDNQHRELFENYKMAPETLREIFLMMEPTGLIGAIYDGDTTICMAWDDMIAESSKRNKMPVVVTDGDIEPLCAKPNHKIMFRYKKEVEDDLLKHVEAHASNKWRAVRTSPGILEFNDPICDKGKGLQDLCRILNIPTKEVMSFGDMQNDIELLQEAGWGVCLLNGAPETKEIANAVTEHTVDDNGMGHYLFDHWILPKGWK